MKNLIDNKSKEDNMKNIARKMIRKAIQTKGRAEIRRAIKKDLKGAPNDPWVLAFDEAFKELMKESK